ncbi:MAG: bifunctional diaminohydroxyphosphoribosylaminopyrimidine deaminase/5-amino-6-(5-phosphoribosylamino)uracil reductase RibD [Spiroplasma sp.]|nr:bifunctional diaminohydroxyphosphoribosylaminopyrimidine deaminase/5-amino-6-(5-phosphoribosylamino)uracil reductase RibD [Mycoplasmatales bacterium]
MDDKFYMKKAIELAKLGTGHVLSNPLVGSIIVKNDDIIGSGFHKKYGSFHAEIEAINSTNEDLLNSTIYVTLEPCFHLGKTPPCVDAIIKNKFKRVVIGMLDPNPLVAGKSIAKLKQNNIEVVTNILEKECMDLNPYFLKHIVHKRPYVIYKYAMTIDGKTATYSKSSKWISNETSRARVHQLRNEMMAIMVGSQTIIFDDPHLDARGENLVDPIKIIIDSGLKTSIDANVYKKGKTIVAIGKNYDKNKEEKFISKGADLLKFDTDKIDLELLMERLGELNINSILIEGGSTLAYHALEAKIIDQVHVYIAPKIIGGDAAPTPIGGRGIDDINDCYTLKNIVHEYLDGDIFIKGDVCLQE